ncbi:MAG TPA: hypothetical protein VIT22_09345 [Pseudoxanthomonas sp.]
MNDPTKFVFSAVMISILAACGKSSEVPEGPIASQIENNQTPPLQVPASLVPAQGGATSLDMQKLADLVANKAPCSLDLIAGKSIVSGPISLITGSDILFQGWISNPDLQSPGTIAVLLSGEQAYAFRGSAGGARPDVAKILKADGLVKSGFNVSSKLVNVAPGEYSVSLIQDWAGSTIQCPTKAKITVTAL